MEGKRSLFQRRFLRAVGLVVSISCVMLIASNFAIGSTKYEEASVKWAKEFEPSVVSEEGRIEELMWFVRASEPYRGMKIRSVAETITTHTWESEVLAKAFEEITGIHVDHDIIDEGSVVERLYTQTASRRRIYDIYVNDADLIGTHLRKLDCVNLTEYMQGEGKSVTNPYLDLDDFFNLESAQDYDGNQLQLPDQQFPSHYLFRYDWFSDPKYKEMFKEKYGYELGVPLNFAAYEDIANFWTNDVKYIDGKRIYGHTDFGKKSPDLGWRFTDAWLSVAGVGDKGLPNGLPVDEWGLRVEDGIPVGFSVKRGGALNGPAAYYAIQKYVDWIKNYAPPYAVGMSCFEAADNFGKGNVAQQIQQYAAFLASPAYRSPESPVTDSEGNPLWRLAPTPHGKYWEEGMKIGYQDAGCWSIPVTIKGDYRAAAWLWAQFCVSKTVSLKKFIVGNTPTRKSTVWSDWCTENTARFGGLIEFYRSPLVKLYTDTGPNVPDYGLLQEQWWHHIALTVTGEKTVEQAMDDLAATCDGLLSHLYLPEYSPRLAEPKTREYWLSQPGAPKPEILERPEPKTLPYEELMELWIQGVDPYVKYVLGE